MELSLFTKANFSMEQTTASISIEDLAKGYLTYQVAMCIHVYVAPTLAILGLFGNSLAFVVMCLRHNRHLACCVYLAGLAISDTMTIGATLHFWVTTVFVVPARGVRLECKVIAFFFNCGAVSSAFTLVAVTIDRFMATCLPLKTMGWRTRRRAFIAEICIFLVACLLSIPFTIHAEFITPTVCSAFSMQSVGLGIYASTSIGLFSFLPFVAILAMNIAIILRIQRLRKKRPNGLGSTQRVNGGSADGLEGSDRPHQVVFSIGPIDYAMCLEMTASTSSLAVTQLTHLDSFVSATRGPECGEASWCEANELSARSPTSDKCPECNGVSCSSGTEEELSASSADGEEEGWKAGAAVEGHDACIGDLKLDVGHGLLSAVSLSDITTLMHAQVDMSGTTNSTQHTNGNSSLKVELNHNLSIKNILTDTTPSCNMSKQLTVADNLLLSSCRDLPGSTDLNEAMPRRSNSLICRTSLQVEGVTRSRSYPSIRITQSTMRKGSASQKGSRLRLAIQRLVSSKSCSERQSLDWQLSKLLLVVSFTFLLLTLPQYIRYLIYTIKSAKASPEAYATYLLVYQVTQKLYMLNSAINFILYCIGTTRFRRDTRMLLCRCRKTK